MAGNFLRGAITGFSAVLMVVAGLVLLIDCGNVAMDARVLLFTAGVTLLTGLLFGLAPALQSTRASLVGAIKNDAPSDRLRRLNLRDILVATQVALSVVLLIGSILVVRSLQHA